MPRWLKLGFPCLLGAWGLVALVLQSGVGLLGLGGFVAACGLRISAPGSRRAA